MTTAMHSARFKRADLGEREVTATLDRSAIERAREDGGSELVIDVARADGTIGALTMSWSPDDIDALLASATEREITLGFDRSELEEALANEADVEAHGLRRRALVFTVVLATAVTAPTVASAHPAGAPGTGSASAAAPAVLVGGAHAAIPVTAPGEFNPATTVGAAGVQSADQTYAASFNPATTVGGATEAAAVVSAPVESPALRVGGAVPAATDATSPASLVGGGGLNTPDPSSPAVMVGGGAPTTTAPFDATAGGPAVSASSQSFLDQNAAEIAALAGGAAIAITAAGFAAAATSRQRPVRPA
jgi:hypothetical protein